MSYKFFKVTFGTDGFYLYCFTVWDVAVLEICFNTIVLVLLVWPPSLYCALHCRIVLVLLVWPPSLYCALRCRIVLVLLVWPPSLYCALRCRRHHCTYKFCMRMFVCTAVNRHVAFDVHVTVHRDKFLIINPTRCTNFSNLYLEWNCTCFGQFLCPSSGVFHCTHSNDICYTGAVSKPI